MKPFSSLSIQRRLMLIAIQSSSVALALSAAGFIAYELATFRGAMVRDLSSEADLIGAQSTAALSFRSPDEAAKNLDALRVRSHITAACIYRENGRIFAGYARAGGAGGWPAAPKKTGYEFANGHLDLFRPIVLDGQRIGTIYLQSDLDEEKKRLTRYAGIGALVMFASFLVSLFLSAKLQRVISEPLSHLADTARAVSKEKNYSVRAVKRSDDELGQLTDGFNEMLGQIQRRDAELQRARDELELRVQERTGELRQEVLERSRAERDLQQQLTRISLLNQITSAVTARQDLDSIVLVVLEQLEIHLPIDYGSAYRIDAAGTNFVALARGPKSRKLARELSIPDAIPIDQSVFRGCLSGDTIYVPETSRRDHVIAQKMAAAGVCSVLATPLIIESEVFGIVVLGRRAADAFTAAERDFIRGLSAHVALAIQQAQLYHDLHKAYNDLRQTQQKVMQQQRLQALGQMASGIAHDINNSLSPVVAYADLLQNMETNLSPTGRKLLGHIKTAGEDVAHIVARMREFYRQRDEFEEFVPVPLNELAAQVVALTRPRWRDIPQSRGIVIGVRTEFAAELPPVHGNGSELREALTNLILNAVDALPAGGVITLRTRQALPHPAGDARDRRVVVEVADNGCGMDEETRRRCLEPFFSTKGKRGTGMGLAMVYGVMERHEGAIEVESEPGAGTTIRLLFPVREPAAKTARRPQAGVPAAALRILCIDDEPLLREVMKEILEAEGHHVSVADGGQTGVEAFRAASARREPFDAVITDLGMPHLNGRQVAQIVKQESPRTPVLMLTGWGTLMKAHGDSPALVDGVLSKPPRINEIRDRLLSCIAKVNAAHG